MVAANLKSETMKLMDKRTAVEAEMNTIIDHLCQPGGPGLSGNLLDFEGFPRQDIDIPSIRAERQRLAVLRNDHKEITEKINENIQVLHSARLASRSPSVKDSDASNSMDLDAIVSIPFAVVDEIADGSPTAEDGLQLGDQIIKFGSVEYQVGINLLQRLATEAQANQGCATPVIVLRQGAPINLTVTPRTWQDRSLLGCSFRIL
ncbi:26S proteasome non-ATPase regulatory subunit 9 isoform X2 [Ricinus communis]|uniref:26S proteasome non-ATPase regulatory subunit 9 isoform X2 n=1 Tax=Ricinus communis TaxID=3988 RepID=UPI00201A35DB|nr:26S proteasome non-ATPase regulatory subunit 9 isoform X2 [Ricinus communis]